MISQRLEYMVPLFLNTSLKAKADMYSNSIGDLTEEMSDKLYDKRVEAEELMSDALYQYPGCADIYSESMALMDEASIDYENNLSDLEKTYKTDAVSDLEKEYSELELEDDSLDKVETLLTFYNRLAAEQARMYEDLIEYEKRGKGIVEKAKTNFQEIYDDFNWKINNCSN